MDPTSFRELLRELATALLAHGLYELIRRLW